MAMMGGMLGVFIFGGFNGHGEYGGDANSSLLVAATKKDGVNHAVTLPTNTTHAHMAKTTIPYNHLFSYMQQWQIAHSCSALLFFACMLSVCISQNAAVSIFEYQ